MNWETMKKSRRRAKRNKFFEARKAMDQIYKDLIEAGWTMRDVDEATIIFVNLFGEVERGEEYVDGADFIKQFLSAEDLVKLEEGGK